MRNLPSYGRWQKRFDRKPVEIIGVHTPETAREKRKDELIAKIKEHGITWPVLMDNESDNWRLWGQRYWPTVYLIDRTGLVRYRWEGELDWKKSGGEEIVARKVEGWLGAVNKRT